MNRVWWLAALATLLILFPLGVNSFGLFGPDEPRYASIAREMSESGDWTTPRLDGKPWLEKPPLLYWMSALGYLAKLGPEASHRIPLALASAAFLVWFARFLRHWLAPRQAIHAAAMLATMAGWLAYSNVGVTDVPLTICYTAAMLLGLRWMEDGRARYAALAGAWLGLAILAKGLVPIALALPLLWFARKRWRQWPILAGAALLIALPWYLAITQREGWAFIDEFIIEHHFSRAVRSDLQHVQPFWFYLPAALGLMLPWTPLLGKAPWRDQRFRYFTVWLLFGLLFFSLMKNKLPGYILPILPAAAILMAVRAQSERAILAVAGTMVVLIGIAKLFVLPALDPQLTARSLASGAGMDVCANDVPRSLRYGLHYYLRRPVLDCWQAPGAQPIPAAADEKQGIRYAVRNATGHMQSGRLLVFASQKPAPILLPDDADTGRVWIASRDVIGWQPGQTILLHPLVNAFPGPIDSIHGGDWSFTVLFDPRGDFAYYGLAHDDFVSDPVRIPDFDPKGGRTYAFTLNRGAPAAALPVARVRVQSALLSRFHREPVYIEADVIPGDASERVLVLHSFGESFAHSRLRTILSGKPRRATLVFLHAVHKFGHHAFADSDVNGSWSRALIEELLPALPPASKTHLLGDGLGGWGALYLKGRFPERFADAWALDPDPIDFRNFFGLDLTKIPQQIYRDEAGKRRPFTKMLSIEESAIRESVLSANGGRWGSWEAIFGPRTSEGIQRQMFGRLDGSVDPVVCNAWLRYNLSARPWAKGMRVITEPEIEDILQSK